MTNPCENIPRRIHYENPAFNPFDYPVSIQRVRLNAGGYDSCGCYFGIGQPLYRATDASGNSIHIRAMDRKTAGQKIETRIGACVWWGRKL